MTLREKLEHNAAFAFVEFGLSEEEFLRQTPRQWALRLAAWERREERTDRRFARVCTVLSWCHGATDTTEDDFIPRARVEVEEQSIDEMAAVLMAVTGQKN